jgi:hypothetical protein
MQVLPQALPPDGKKLLTMWLHLSGYPVYEPQQRWK